MTRVADLMTRQVVSVSTDATLAEALTYLATQHITGAAVLDHRHRLVGVITRSDIMELEAEAGDGRARARLLDGTVVRDAMSHPALTIAPEAELKDAALAMEYGDVRRLFVEEEGKLVGVISRSDVSRALATGQV
jgi:CBS domain-containing protein